MIIEPYFITRDVFALNIFARVIRGHQVWRSELLSLCSERGFESFIGPDFSVPDYYLKERFSQSSRFRSFTQVLDKSVYADNNFDVYTLRRDYPPGADFHREAEEISRNSLTQLGVSVEDYGRPVHVGYQQVICMLLGIDHTYNTGDISAFTQIWRVIDKDQNPALITSIPVSIDKETRLYTAPVVPDIWTEISAIDVIEVFNAHNTRLGRDA